MSSHDDNARSALLAEAQEWKRRAASLQALEADVDRFRATSRDLNEELISLRSDLEQELDRSDRGVRELAELRTEFERLSAELTQLKQRRKSARPMAKRLRQDVMALAKERDDLADRLQSQYDLKWSRIGGELRKLARRPVMLPATAVRVARIIVSSSKPSGRRPRTTGVIPESLDLASLVMGSSEEDLIAGWLQLVDPEPVQLSGRLDQGDDRHVDPRIDAVAVELLGSADESVVQVMADAALARGDASWLADIIERSDRFPPIGPARLVRLVQGLHALGEIERPIRLLEHEFAPTSERLRIVLAQRRRESQILRSGLEIPLPTLAPMRSDGVDALYLLHNSLPHKSGGYATRTHGLLRQLNERGRTVVGVTRPGFPAENGVFDQIQDLAATDVIDGVTYCRLLGSVTALPRTDAAGFVHDYADKLTPIIEQYAPQLIHGASNWWNGQAAVTAAAALGIPSIYEVRGLWEITRASRQPEWSETEVYRLDARYEADVACRADRVITITNGLRDEMVRRGVDGAKITVVPNAVDTDRFRPLERDAGVVSALDLDGKVVLGFVGSMTFYEGLDDLLEALKIIRESSSLDVVALFVGDGPVRGELEALAARLGITDSCRFVGRVPHDEVERYLSVIDITPFYRKPLPVCEMVSPLKPLESMASGIPILVSDVAALAEMIPNETAGVIVAKGNVQALAEGLQSLVEDPDRRRQIAENALEWVRSERSWATITDRVDRLYTELLA